MSPKPKEELVEDARELQEDVDELERDLADEQNVPTQHELRDVVIAIEVTTRTDDPDVTDAQILAAAEQQVTLPNTIWVDKPEGGQIPITVVHVGPHVEPDPPIE
jgi:hypothetical protein